MKRYILRRLVQAALVTLVVATVMFFLFRILPGDPTTMLVEAGMPDDARQRLLEEWGLTGSLFDQYRTYIANLFSGDLGRSFFHRRPVTEVLWPRIANTLALALPAIVLGALLGSVLGAMAGWSRRGGAFERGSVIVATLIRGTPAFVIGVIVLQIFSSMLGWFPAFGMTSVLFGGADQSYFSLDFLWHAVLPIMTLAIFFIPENFLLMRSGVLQARREDYIQLVRAKGVTEGRVAMHAVRNSLNPVIAWLLPSLAETVAGVVVIEVVFAWPGIGRELVLAVSRQDFPVAQGAFLLVAVMIVLANLAADLITARLDPRIVYR